MFRLQSGSQSECNNTKSSIWKDIRIWARTYIHEHPQKCLFYLKLKARKFHIHDPCSEHAEDSSLYTTSTLGRVPSSKTLKAFECRHESLWFSKRDEINWVSFPVSGSHLEQPEPCSSSKARVNHYHRVRLFVTSTCRIFRMQDIHYPLRSVCATT